MDRPRVIIHNLVSLDSRLDGFPADVGLYFELASRLPHQAVLNASATLLAAAASLGIDMSGEDSAPAAGPAALYPAGSVPGAPAGGGAQPLLAIVDSRGRLTRFAWLRKQPFWRDVLVLCSAATPAGHLDRLRRHGVGYAVLGDIRVDLGAALRVLAAQHGVAVVWWTRAAGSTGRGCGPG